MSLLASLIVIMIANFILFHLLRVSVIVSIVSKYAINNEHIPKI